MTATTRQRIRFLLWFATIDLWPPERRAQLHERLLQFLTRAGSGRTFVVGLVHEAVLRNEMSPAALRALQGDVRDLIASALKGAVPRIPLPEQGKWTVRGTLLRGGIVVSGDRVRDVVCMVAFLLLNPRDKGLSRILRCAECSSTFIRERRQRFCSPTCLNRATQRTWRERHKEPRR